METNNYHNVHANMDGVFNANSGVLIDLNRPTEEMINVQDIGTALSKICRFGGHSNNFYSVAQHSILVMALCPEYLQREALLHDATEAYLGDVIKPLKNLLGLSYTEIEKDFERVIIRKFKLDASHLLEVKKYDKQALELEHRRFIMGDEIGWIEKMNELNLNPAAWDHREAKKLFLKLYQVLFNC